MWARSRCYLAPVMSEEQLKAAEAEATAQVEEGVEEISEEDLEGVAGGNYRANAGVIAPSDDFTVTVS